MWCEILVEQEHQMVFELQGSAMLLACVWIFPNINGGSLNLQPNKQNHQKVHMLKNIFQICKCNKRSFEVQLYDYMQLVKLHNAVTFHALTFQVLHRFAAFDEKWQNLPTLVISHKVIRDTKIYMTRYYENVDFQKWKKSFF